MKEYIEREVAIELGKKQSCAGIIDGGDFCNISANMLRKIPAADVVEVRHGRWIDEKGNDVLLDDCGCPKASAWCSKCGDWLTASDEYSTRGRYCPNCGAKMDGGIING